MTTLTVRHTRGVGSAPYRGALAGTRRLVRFDLRRDRIRLTAWLLGITLLSVSTATSFAGLYATPADRQGTAATMDSPAGLAMTGPRHYLTDYNLGSMMGHQMLGFTAVLVALMSIFLVVRHTRTEEESGRAELLRATVVGHHAHLSAALIVAVGANLALALLIAVTHGALGIEGMGWSGSVLYGAAHAAVGLTFAGVAAVTAQVMEHPRGASGAASAILGASYVFRAVGDASNQTLSWFSPIGWVQATYVYVDDRWWPLLLNVVAAVVLSSVGLALSTRRDLGAGLRATKPGRASATTALRRPLGLAVRLQRSVLIGFVVALALTGVSYGSFLADVEEMLANVEGLDEAVAAMGGATLTESFLSMVTVVMSIIASIFVVLAVLRARSEEVAGRAEVVLATRLTRARWLGSHLTVALLGGALLSLVAALGLAVAGVGSTGDTALFGTAIGAALAYQPAHWVTAGVTLALYGWVPRLATLAWVVPGYAFLVGYLGRILQVPDWMQNLSPYSIVPTVPAEDLSWPPLLGLTALAALLVALGVLGFRRRSVGAA
ncbi:MAG TPA: polyketide antibiotic transporter [Nocardioidaceae bacterium]